MMRRLIRTIDRHMRRRLGVFEFTDDPECIFRLSLARAQRPLRVQAEVVPPGEKVVLIHFWNEQLPKLPADGPDMAWAVRGRRQLAASCRLLARYLQDEPRVADARAVGGSTVLFAPGDGGERVFARVGGFVLAESDGSYGRFAAFWENVYTWMLMWAFNEVTLRRRRLLGMRRIEFWTSPAELVSRWRATDAGRGVPRRSA